MSKNLNKLKKDIKKGEKLRKSRGIYINLELATNRTPFPLSIKSGLHCLVEFRSL
jgi:hypothetical protein